MVYSEAKRRLRHLAAAIQPKNSTVGTLSGATIDLDVLPPVSPNALASKPALQGLMDRRYHTDNLVVGTPETFKAGIDGFLGLVDHEMEGYASLEFQRDLSIRFQWGHDTNFGTFSLSGPMGENHLNAVSTFIDHFKALPADLTGQKVLDIGVWTGGTSLLLAAMGAEVVAIEEVKKYVDCLNFVKNSFALDKLTPLHLSLYDCFGEDFYDRFDYVLFPGVLYHLSDQVIALRHLFNALCDGGQILIQTTGIDAQDASCRYDGPTVFTHGTKEQLNRGGWNWFLPSGLAVAGMMYDVGFRQISITKARQGKRSASMSAVGTREQHLDMTRAGLSVPRIR